MFHFSDEALDADNVLMTRRSHSFDLLITVSIVWVHMALTHITGGVSTLGTFALWATVIAIGGARIAMLRREINGRRATSRPRPRHLELPDDGRGDHSTGDRVDDEQTTTPDVSAGEPAHQSAITLEPSGPAAAEVPEPAHPRLVPVDVLRTRFEHTLIRRPAATDVVAAAIIEVTRTSEHELEVSTAAELRRSVVDRIEAHLDMADSLAVTDDGRFVILIERPESKTALLARVRSMVKSAQRPHHVGTTSEPMSARAGVAFADNVTRSADLLLQQSRRALGLTIAGEIEIHGGEVHTTHVDKYELAADLARSMRDHRLSVYWQPVVDVATHEVVELEALTRWHHPSRGLIGPETFIPLADETGQSVHLHHWLVETAVRQLRSWQLAHPGLAVKVSLNLSAVQLADPGLADELRRTCERNSVEPSCFVLEVSERAIDSDLKPTLDAIAAIGAGIALDDFGTGSQSLSDLDELPLTSVKIDRTVIAGFGDSGHEHIASAIVELAGLLGLPMIAEGVERPDQALLLADRGFAMAQGHLFARPMSTEAMSDLFDQLTESGGRLCAPAAVIVD